MIAGSNLTLVYFLMSSTDNIMYYHGQRHFTYDFCLTKNRCLIDQTYHLDSVVLKGHLTQNFKYTFFNSFQYNKAKNSTRLLVITIII